MSTAAPDVPALPVGATMDRGFALLRRRPRALLLPQLALNLATVVPIVLLFLLGWLLVGDVDTHVEVTRQSTIFGDSTLERREVADLSGGQVAVVVVLGVVAALVSLWFSLAAYVSVVRGAERAVADEPHLPLGQAMTQALRATPPLFGLGVVFAVAAAVAVGLLGLLVALLAQASAGLAVLAALAVLCLLVYVGVRLSLWPVAHLTEGTGFASFGRSWALTAGRFWSLLALFVLVGIVVAVVFSVLTIVLEALVLGAAWIDDAVGVAALIPFAVLYVLLGLIATAAYLAPIVVAYRTIAGIDGPAGRPTDGGSHPADTPPHRDPTAPRPAPERLWSRDAPPADDPRD
ncbi:hypothetical protein [Patulibacter sp. SYSU D01012]|uniref:hypothetical protein n=1 Tax=Patulibacter sp. SYSU D01012 TaxID=2817381 RepID=UPI001B30CF4C|nr:hypothetical protein [Patulibacter sp. SYSU D01012]